MAKLVTFEQTATRMKQMSPVQRQAEIDAQSKLCTCPTCPSYVGTGENELFFCLQGKSQVLTLDKGCVCPDCPVTPKLRLRWNDYCFKGSGEERLEQVSRPFSWFTLDEADDAPQLSLLWHSRRAAHRADSFRRGELASPSRWLGALPEAVVRADALPRIHGFSR